jgi:hypothetical protein
MNIVRVYSLFYNMTSTLRNPESEDVFNAFTKAFPTVENNLNNFYNQFVKNSKIERIEQDIVDVFAFENNEIKSQDDVKCKLPLGDFIQMTFASSKTKEGDFYFQIVSELLRSSFVVNEKLYRTQMPLAKKSEIATEFFDFLKEHKVNDNFALKIFLLAKVDPRTWLYNNLELLVGIMYGPPDKYDVFIKQVYDEKVSGRYVIDAVNEIVCIKIFFKVYTGALSLEENEKENLSYYTICFDNKKNECYLKEFVLNPNNLFTNPNEVLKKVVETNELDPAKIIDLPFITGFGAFAFNDEMKKFENKPKTIYDVFEINNVLTSQRKDVMCFYTLSDYYKLAFYDKLKNTIDGETKNLSADEKFKKSVKSLVPEPQKDVFRGLRYKIDNEGNTINVNYKIVNGEGKEETVDTLKRVVDPGSCSGNYEENYMCIQTFRQELKKYFEERPLPFYVYYLLYAFSTQFIYFFVFELISNFILDNFDLTGTDMFQYTEITLHIQNGNFYISVPLKLGYKKFDPSIENSNKIPPYLTISFIQIFDIANNQVYLRNYTVEKSAKFRIERIKNVFTTKNQSQREAAGVDQETVANQENLPPQNANQEEEQKSSDWSVGKQALAGLGAGAVVAAIAAGIILLGGKNTRRRHRNKKMGGTRKGGKRLTRRRRRRRNLTRTRRSFRRKV